MLRRMQNHADTRGEVVLVRLVAFWATALTGKFGILRSVDGWAEYEKRPPINFNGEN
jgi:hypothetical protein